MKTSLMLTLLLTLVGATFSAYAVNVNKTGRITLKASETFGGKGIGSG